MSEFKIIRGFDEALIDAKRNRLFQTKDFYAHTDEAWTYSSENKSG